MRLNAVAAIGKLGPDAAAAIKPLADVLAGDKSPDVRIQAANVLAKPCAEGKEARSSRGWRRRRRTRTRTSAPRRAQTRAGGDQEEAGK